MSTDITSTDHIILTLFMLSGQLVSGQQVAYIADEDSALLTEFSCVPGGLDLGQLAVEEPVDEGIDLLLRRELSRVECCNH